MSEDCILVAPESAEFAARRFPGRPLTVIADMPALQGVLASSRASSLLYCGDWPRLTVCHSRALAEWARQDPSRGCGVCLAAEACCPADAHQRDDVVYKFDHGEPAIAFRAAAAQTLASDELLERLLHQELPTPTGVVLTGHGAEYCVRFGSKWLSTYETALLGGPSVFPSSRLGAAVFLNCCSSLRLGDSCVPKKYSLAHLLSRMGTAVIGSFRNMHNSPRYGEVFAEALLAGQPLGQIVNTLNLLADRIEGKGAAFQLLGDPCISYPTTSTRRCAVPEHVPMTEPHCIREFIDESVGFEQLGASLSRWMPEDPQLAGCCTRLAQLTDRAGQVFHAWHMEMLDRGELALMLQEMEGTLDVLRIELLDALVRSVQTDGWIENRYARVCRRADATKTRCERCGGQGHKTRYEPFAAYLPCVERQECDLCGTTREQVGNGPTPRGAMVCVGPGCVTVDLPPLAERTQGAVFLHRMPAFRPIVWPCGGGKISIADAELSFGGRLTLVAASLGQGRLTLDYYTFFVGPDQVPGVRRTERCGDEQPA
jgi:hypothetical protein